MQDLYYDVIEKILSVVPATGVGSFMAVSRYFQQFGRKAWVCRLESDREKLTSIAGNYSLINVQLFIHLYCLMNDLQTDQLVSSRLFVHRQPLIFSSDKFDSATKLIACRDSPTLVKALIKMGLMKLVPFTSSNSRFQGGDTTELPRVMLYNPLEHGAIIVHKTAERPNVNALCPVALWLLCGKLSGSSEDTGTFDPPGRGQKA